MQAVALAGGVTEDANAAQDRGFPDDWRPAAGGCIRPASGFAAVKSTDPKIYPGDIIVVDGNSVKAAYRQLLNSFPMLSIFRPF